MGVSLDDAVTQIDQSISRPIPGATRVTESLVEDEMELFMKAQMSAT